LAGGVGAERPSDNNVERRTSNVERLCGQSLLIRLQSRWSELPRQALKQVQIPLATALTDSAPVGLTENVLTIELPADFQPVYAGDPAIQQCLATLIASIAGTPLTIITRTRASAADLVGGDARRYRMATDHPLVKDIIKRFEADILAREVINPQQWERR
jgi:hypothetical protein